jgi:hypothetical protein
MRKATKIAALSFALAGLVPAIHVFGSSSCACPGRLDARNKSGHDVPEFAVAGGE